jgi:hypothetical protein
VLLELKYCYYDVPVGPEPVTHRANGSVIQVRAVLRDSCIGCHSMLGSVAKQLSVVDM